MMWVNHDTQKVWEAKGERSRWVDASEFTLDMVVNEILPFFPWNSNMTKLIKVVRK